MLKIRRLFKRTRRAHINALTARHTLRCWHVASVERRNSSVMFLGCAHVGNSADALHRLAHLDAEAAVRAQLRAADDVALALDGKGLGSHSTRHVGVLCELDPGQLLQLLRELSWAAGTVDVRHQCEGRRAQLLQFLRLRYDVHAFLHVQRARHREPAVDFAHTDTAATARVIDVCVVAHRRHLEPSGAQGGQDPAGTELRGHSVNFHLQHALVGGFTIFTFL